eukprot:Lithocolla_globosa_v1_NODE_1144_length_2839_cov_59.750449.p5 type:complete len:130 gc:universal NODE_1144_length_2839_cov_59.750449:1402-1791(+)
MYLLTLNPASQAFCASNPAPSRTSGLEVFVQEVMAEMTTEPWLMVYSLPSYSNLASDLSLSSAIPKPLKPIFSVKHLLKSSFIADRGTWSWGRLGPDRQGLTEDRSNSSTSVNTGSAPLKSRSKFCALR